MLYATPKRTEESGGLQSIGLKSIDKTEATEHTKGLLAGSSPVKKAWDCLYFTVKT